MKKYPLILSAIVLFAVSFSACSILPKTETPKPVSADSVLDDQIYLSATRSMNAGECQNIKDQAKMTECQDVIVSLNTTAKAVDQSDLSLCKTINLERYQNYCDDSVNQKINQKELLQKKLDEYKAIEETGLKNLDSTECLKIDDENKKLACKYNVISTSALKNDDPLACDQIGNDGLTAVCKRLFEK